LVGNILHYDSMNEKRQLIQERLYSEDRKRGRALGSRQGVVGWQKSREKLGHREKEQSLSPAHCEEEGPSQDNTDSPGDRLQFFQRSLHLPQALNSVWRFVRQWLLQCGRPQ
jgi:hypothetical protein